METFKQKIEILARREKMAFQHQKRGASESKKSPKPQWIFSESSLDYFKEGNVTLKKLLLLLRNNHPFLIDVTFHLGGYINGMPQYAKFLMGTFVRTFFDDFGSPAHSVHDFHRFMFAIIDVPAFFHLLERHQRTRTPPRLRLQSPHQTPHRNSPGEG